MTRIPFLTRPRMKNRLPTSSNAPTLLLAMLLAGTGLVAGCATSKTVDATVYDLGSLGPLSASSAAVVAPMNVPMTVPATSPMITPITVADVTSAPWLDSQMMVFRLSYANDQQPRPYAASRWSMPPPQLLGQRIKARMAQAGVAVLSGSDGAVNVPMLRIEADDFSQRFDNPGSSDVHVAWRASVFNGRLLVAQKTFEQQRPAASADAAGGARALAATTDALIGDMMTWLATLPVKR